MNIVDVNLIQIPLATWESSINAQIYMETKILVEVNTLHIILRILGKCS